MPIIPEPPDYEREYDAVMEQAAQCLREGFDGPGMPPGLLPFQAAVVAAYAREKARGRHRTAEVWFRLMVALKDVERGVTPRALSPLFASRAHPTWMVNRIALAVRVVDELMADGTPMPAAIRQVLPELRLIPGTDADRVANWRHELHKADGGRMPRKFLLRYRAPLPPEVGNIPKSRAAWLLRQLQHGVHSRPPRA
jgi:hypothetical protein